MFDNNIKIYNILCFIGLKNLDIPKQSERGARVSPLEELKLINSIYEISVENKKGGC